MTPRRLTAAALATLLACSAALAQNSTPAPVTTATAPTPTPPSGPELTLEECIARAVAKNFDLQIGRFGPEIAREGITVAKGNYETQLAVTGSTGESHTPLFDGKTSDLRAGVTQRLYTGTTVSASSNLNRSSSDPSPLLNPAYDADMTLSVRQSLLRGFGTDVNRANIERAEIGLERSKLDFKVVALSVILDTENAYYNLAFAREQLAVRNFSFSLAQRLFDEAKIRRDTGVATNLDVLTAEVGLAAARRNVLLAEQEEKDRQDALLALISQFELDSVVGTVRFPVVEDTTPVFASSYQLAKLNQPDYLSLQASVEQLKLDVKVAKDNTRPDLTVGGAVGLGGTNGSSGDAYGDAFDKQKHSWQVDFAFSYPWGQPSDKARYRQGLSILSREQIRLKQLEQFIEVQVRSAVRSVETSLESYKIAAFGARLSGQQYDLEKAKFDAGQSTSRRVLEAQDDLEAARVSELQAKVTLQNAVSVLHRIEGSSLQRYSIVPPEVTTP